MGRHSTRVTKSGKFMNPTDQARKEARKKELKKNKKNRQIVRTTVLKSKQPDEIIKEMEVLDEQEYATEKINHHLNPKVIQEKRGKLRATYFSVMKLYHKEDLTVWKDLRKKIDDYEKKRSTLEQYHLAVKSAEDVVPDEIPLPDVPFGTAGIYPPGFFIPSVPGVIAASFHEPSHSILKKPAATVEKKRRAPGPPPGMPPDLSDSEEEDEDDEEAAEKNASRVRFSDTDSTEKDSRTKYKELAKKMASGEIESSPSVASAFPMLRGAPYGSAPPRLLRPPPPPPGVPPPRAMMGVRIPPPPPGYPPQRMTLIRPPPPPTGPPGPTTQVIGPVLSAPPSISKPDVPTMSGTMISVKPQLRNLGAETIKLVPVSVKVRREQQEKLSVKPRSFPTTRVQAVGGAFDLPTTSTRATMPQATKDDAYDAFMREMENLL